MAKGRKRVGKKHRRGTKVLPAHMLAGKTMRKRGRKKA